MAQISLTKEFPPTTKSVLSINEAERTSTKTVLNVVATTNLGSSSSYVGSGIALYGKIEVSYTSNGSTTTKNKTLTLKNSSDNWQGTSTHSTSANFEIDVPASVTSLSIKYTVWYSDETNNTMSGTTTMTLSKMISTMARIGIGIDVEQAMKLSITQYDSSYTQNLRIYYGNTLIATFENVKDEDSIQLSQTQVDNLFTLVQDSKFFELPTYLDTYSGNTKLGEYYTKNIGFIRNCEPLFTDFSFQDSNDTTYALTGDRSKFIKGFSTLEVTINEANKAVAQKKATMTSYIIGDTSVNYADNIVKELLNYALSTIKVSAVDNRGQTTTVEKAVDLLNYNAISVADTEATAERKNGSGEEIIINLNGNFFNSSFGTQNNVLSIAYKYRIAGTTGNFTYGTTTITPTIDGNNFSITNKSILGDTDGGFDTANSYEIVFEIEDKLSIYEISFVVSAGVNAVEIEGNKITKLNGKSTINYEDDEDGITQLKNMKGKLLYPKTKLKELYNGSTDTEAILSQSLENCEYIDIVYQNDDNQYGTTRLYDPENKSTFGSIIRRTGNGNTLMINSCLFAVGANKITISRNKQTNILLSGSINDDPNKIYIIKVLGNFK